MKYLYAIQTGVPDADQEQQKELKEATCRFQAIFCDEVGSTTELERLLAIMQADDVISTLRMRFEADAVDADEARARLAAYEIALEEAAFRQDGRFEELRWEVKREEMRDELAILLAAVDNDTLRALVIVAAHDDGVTTCAIGGADEGPASTDSLLNGLAKIGSAVRKRGCAEYVSDFEVTIRQAHGETTIH
jgi:hypothetical protein